MEFPGVFVFGLGISKGSKTILWNIQGLSFVLSGICRGKVKKVKNARGGQKFISSAPLVWIFSGIPQCVIHSYNSLLAKLYSIYLVAFFYPDWLNEQDILTQLARFFCFPHFFQHSTSCVLFNILKDERLKGN